jgi:hypothetical protein
MMRVLEIDDYALLATVEKSEVDALTSPSRLPRTHLVAAGPLDLDDFRAGFGEHQRRQWTRQQRGEIEDDDSFERSHELVSGWWSVVGFVVRTC